MKAGITTASGGLLVGDTIDMLVELYDIRTDQRRPVTQADVDELQRCRTAFGLLVRFLRRTDHAAVAGIALGVVRGDTSLGDAERRIIALLEHTA
jgi:hypothetical protein